MAGNMFAHMPGHRPGIDVEPAAGRAANDDADGFAFVEIVGEKGGGLEEAKSNG